MLDGWIVFVLVVYGVAIAFIFLYSLVQLNLLIIYRKARRKSTDLLPPGGQAPSVLVQLPVYNERYVVERLIDAVCQLKYYPGRFEIQVLDDSTDESAAIAGRCVDLWLSRGVPVAHIRRADRTGFKAGALAYGLTLNKADLVAIFDADFIPPPDFLLKTVPHFADPSVGMVQARWAHLNREYSLLTRVQAFGLDAHFTIEQTGRNSGGHFMNFNGTAGVWRRTCITDAGGWSADTLTEDLDLSYRAQMKGWRFKYLQDLCAPAELPAEINALKNQQYRWNKGAAECAVKHLKSVLGAKRLNFNTRIHAFFHLLNSSVFVWILLAALLSLPLVWIKMQHPELRLYFLAGGLLIGSFVILGMFYFTAFRQNMPAEKFQKLDFLWLYPAFLSISMGMSLHNSRAVIQGWMGKKTDFIRTPKWNLIDRTGSWGQKGYQVRKLSSIGFMEGILALYFLFALVYEIHIGEWGFVFMHLILLFGFAFVFLISLKHRFGK